MYPEERQQAIAAQVLSQGRASVADLAHAYDVTTETVRRDLAVLDRAGLLRRVHGGAVPVRALHVVEPDVDSREITGPITRRRSRGRRPSSFRSPVPPCCSTRAPPPPGWRPCSPGPGADGGDQRGAIAARLATMGSVTLQLLGGRVRGLTQAAVGEPVLRALDTLRVDIAFIGANGISVRHGLSTPTATRRRSNGPWCAAPTTSW